MAAVINGSLLSVNGTAVPFITTGAAGVSDYPLGATTAAMPAGFTTGAAAAVQAAGNTAYVPQPAAGATGPAAYNPDVRAATFWSNYNGFTMTNRELLTLLGLTVASLFRAAPGTPRDAARVHSLGILP
jgi:hypothetical protein